MHSIKQFCDKIDLIKYNALLALLGLSLLTIAVVLIGLILVQLGGTTTTAMCVESGVSDPYLIVVSALLVHLQVQKLCTNQIMMYTTQYLLALKYEWFRFKLY